MITDHENPNHRYEGSLGAAEPLAATQNACPKWTPAVRTPPEDLSFPLSDFALEKPSFLASLNTLGMKATARLAMACRGLFGSRAGGRIGILTYHRVSAVVPRLPPPTHNVTPDRFRAQLAGLLDRGFCFWPLRELLQYHAAGRLTPPRTLGLTFDDGFQSVYTDALPILRELHVPATVFLTTGYLDSTAPFPFDTWGQAYRDALPPPAYRPLTLQQCREMVDGGLIDLGAHTHTHRDLRGQPETFRKDVQNSVDYVRATFGLTDVMFAFPYGSRRRGFASGAMVTAAKQTGVNCGLTTECSLIDPGSDPFAWGRFNAFSWDTAATLAAKLDGWYTWVARLKQFLRR